MCGINGILRLSSAAPPVPRRELAATRDRMRSRGPDGEGCWISPRGEIGLAHRRLAILDLSAAGNQPMASADGRYHLVHNGEIYNFRRLRRRLEAAGERFTTASDTEVMLALYARYGAGMLPMLRGMFAFALWDDRERRLLLARDPYGIKPLYWSARADVLRFASQVEALAAGGGVETAIDPAAVAGFLLWGSVPEPLTVYRAVRALPAGCYLEVIDGVVGEPRRYHLFATGPEDEGDAADDRDGDGETGGAATGSSAAERAVTAIESSVVDHLVSDVPVALFLSAGLDSSLVAALACRHLPTPPTTFTLRFAPFAGSAYDEAPLAAAVARALGTRHVEQQVERDDFLALWPQALAAMDQPSIDGFNTFVVSKLAAEAGLKVVLSGVGGDELLGSYPSFTDVPRWARWARAGRRVPGAAALWPWLAGRRARRRPKLAGLLRHGSTLAGAYYLRRGLFLPAELPALMGAEAAAEGLAAYDPVADAERVLDPVTPVDPWVAVHLLESSRYLRNQLLRDADWAAMAHSLELRVPLVDARLQRRLAALAFEPARSAGKAELVRRAAPELPAAVFTRRKSGFAIPVTSWLEGGDGPAHPSGSDSRRLALEVLARWEVVDPKEALTSLRNFARINR